MVCVFRYESERSLFQNVDADVSGLCNVLDDLSYDKSNLEAQFKSLTEELVYRKKTHEEVRYALAVYICW